MCSLRQHDECGRSLERLKRRIQQLRLHHDRNCRGGFSQRICQQLVNIREEAASDSPDFSSLTGSDPDYNPAQAESSCSDEDEKILGEPSSFKESSSDEAVGGLDADSGEDEDQETGKCNIKKQKTPRTYVKRKRKKKRRTKMK
ncbi:hypothetical protein ABVT39_001764 [Epinephelus coioides]